MAKGIGGEPQRHNITSPNSTEEVIPAGDVAVFGVPVYSGRVPEVAARSLRLFKGDGTPAVCVVVYGNREYDDALLELKEIVEAGGFRIVAAGAFVAQHSIFPAVAEGRPDEKDLDLAENFGRAVGEMLEGWEGASPLPEVGVKGNFPYRAVGKIPLRPRGDRRCTRCGTCVKACPARAIPEDHPRKTDKKLCIACGRCIAVCPEQARHYGGLLYQIAGKKFVKAYGGVRKEPEWTVGVSSKKNWNADHRLAQTRTSEPCG